MDVNRFVVVLSVQREMSVMCFLVLKNSILGTKNELHANSDRQQEFHESSKFGNKEFQMRALQ